MKSLSNGNQAKIFETQSGKHNNCYKFENCHHTPALHNVRFSNLLHTLFKRTGIIGISCCYSVAVAMAVLFVCYGNTVTMTSRKFCYNSAI